MEARPVARRGRHGRRLRGGQPPRRRQARHQAAPPGVLEGGADPPAVLRRGADEPVAEPPEHRPRLRVGARRGRDTVPRDGAAHGAAALRVDRLRTGHQPAAGRAHRLRRLAGAPPRAPAPRDPPRHEAGQPLHDARRERPVRREGPRFRHRQGDGCRGRHGQQDAHRRAPGDAGLHEPRADQELEGRGRAQRSLGRRHHLLRDAHAADPVPRGERVRAADCRPHRRGDPHREDGAAPRGVVGLLPQGAREGAGGSVPDRRGDGQCAHGHGARRGRVEPGSGRTATGRRGERHSRDGGHSGLEHRPCAGVPRPAAARDWHRPFDAFAADLPGGPATAPHAVPRDVPGRRADRHSRRADRHSRRGAPRTRAGSR